MKPKSAEAQIKKQMARTWRYMRVAGWQCDGFARNGHIVVSRDGKSVQIPSTPGDVKSDLATRTRLRHHDRVLGHVVDDGLDPNAAANDERAAKLEADRKRNEAATLKALERSLTTTHTPITSKPKLSVVEPSKPRRNPKREKAGKWARWFVMDQHARGRKRPMAQVELQKAAKAAGFGWVLARELLLEAGAVCDYRGRAGSHWTFPVPFTGGTGGVAETGPAEASNTQSSEPEPCVGDGQAHTLPADPVSSGESLTGMELERELGRLEGMVSAADAIMGTGSKMSEQLERVLRLMGES